MNRLWLALGVVTAISGTTGCVGVSANRTVAPSYARECVVVNDRIYIVDKAKGTAKLVRCTDDYMMPESPTESDSDAISMRR